MSYAPSFLQTELEAYSNTEPPIDRPHVTLTFAQSLDAKIAGAKRRQLILSGKESMVMTHWMRTMHDAILVGIGTALNDDPQLNVRHLPPPEANAPRHHLPRPIILDSQLRTSPTCKLLQNFRNGTGRRPYILHSPIPTNAPDNDPIVQRKGTLKDAGALTVPVPPLTGSKLDPEGEHPSRLPTLAVLKVLRDLGIKSLMVEGGAQIISAFVSEAPIDRLILTIAPVFVGDAGIGYRFLKPADREMWEVAGTHIVGKDTIVVMKGMV